MKVLMTSNANNPYITELVKGLSTALEIKNSVNDFWESDDIFDVVHIQWPEELFKWLPPSAKEVDKFKYRLEIWKERGAKIVVTRHNELPNKENAFSFKPLYDLSYSIADAVVHLGQYSFEHLADGRTINRIIPHHIYTSYPNSANRKEARNELGIPEKAKVILCFGKIRTQDEKKFIFNAFSKINITNKYLLIPGFFERLSFKNYPLKKISIRLKHILKKMFSNQWLGFKFVPHNKVQIFFNAADAVLIPRLENLTSGVIYLSLAFNKSIVGPESGNITEMLDKFGFPKFNATDESSVIAALEKALCTEEFCDISEADKVQFSLSYSVKQHIDLYTTLTQ
ncbi:hypothetical protein LJ707_11720 [Mucilaginibacter sp. UR6-1]|uniref:glycosyltransferase n=1 Tax=Mucilaginibacter sp. UR6-1 TaxID=1435643 RepID=UPI001E319C8E|nr:hypothetical protein [Mucilaginibacter sp. UR6-1]MCC8409598.1 hypothetical protein [Mucilaginibacter sp. UR6-1]